MSLYLPEQKLGSHSQPESSSHKFMLKGRQTGAMHRGHAWVFRAESHDTLMAWYEDIENLIEKTGEARNAFVRRHIRSLSGNSYRTSSISSDGVMDEDEADQTPYSSQSAVLQRASSVKGETPAQRPQPGGRFPSDVQIDRNLQATMSRSSGESSGAREVVDDSVVPESSAPHASSQQDDYILSQGNNEVQGTWAGASTTTDPDGIRDQASQQEQAPPSQAPVVANNEATTQSPTHTSVYVIGGQISDVPQREESQRSRQTHSTTHSLMTSTPTSEATSPPSETAAANLSARPNVQPKESESTIDMLKMPGKYPRPVTN